MSFICKKSCWRYRLQAFVLLTLVFGYTCVLCAQELQSALALHQAGMRCETPRLASLGAEQLVVAWVASDESGQQGVHWRSRLGYLWGPTYSIDMAETKDPQDLALVLDDSGRVFMVWSARSGEDRLLFFTTFDVEALYTEVQLIDAERMEPSQPLRQEFPSLALTGDGGALVVWQQSSLLDYTIRAAYLNGAGSRPAGVLSGPCLSAVAPQIVGVAPWQVLWFEIDSESIGSLPRIEAFHRGSAQWYPAPAERILAELSFDGVALASCAQQGTLLCWQAGASDNEGTAMQLAQLSLNEQGGSWSALPELVEEGTVSDFLLTDQGAWLAWQAWDARGARAQVARLTEDDRWEVAVVSEEEQRAPASPTITGDGQWGAVAWIDRYADGGDGGLYFRPLENFRPALPDLE